MAYTPDEFEDFRCGYEAAARFTTTDDTAVYEDGEPMGEAHIDDDIAYPLSPELVAQMDAICRTFLEQCFWKNTDRIADVADLIRSCEDTHTPGSHDDTVWDHAGRDFWYTSQGHGVGFWDGDWPAAAGEILSRAAKRVGADDWYVGDDGMVYSGKSFRFRDKPRWVAWNQTKYQAVSGPFLTHEEAKERADAWAKQWPTNEYIVRADPDVETLRNVRA